MSRSIRDLLSDCAHRCRTAVASRLDSDGASSNNTETGSGCAPEEKGGSVAHEKRSSQGLTVLERHIGRINTYRDWIISEIDEGDTDVCFVHDSLALEAGRAIKQLTSCTLIYDCVEHPAYDGRAPAAAKHYQSDPSAADFLHRHEGEVLKEVNLVLVGTPGVAEFFKQNIDSVDPCVVRNCLDYEDMPVRKDIRDDCGLTERDHLILYPNTVYPLCGLDKVLDALPLLPDNVNLAVMGMVGGPMRTVIADYVERFRGRVHVLPLRSPADLLSYRSGADFSLIPLDPNFPNHNTCLPNRVFESIMSRLPLLVSDLPHVRGIVEEFDCGMVFPDLTPGAVAGTINQAYERLGHYENRMQCAAETLCWENERAAFLEAVRPVLGTSKDLNILFLANKPASTNRRIMRFTRELAALGHHVMLRSLASPFEELRDPRIEYIEMEDRWKKKGPPNMSTLGVARGIRR